MAGTGGKDCRICGSADLSQSVRAPEMMFGTGEHFDYLRCPDCGTLQIAEIPGDMAPYYAAGSYYAFNNVGRAAVLKRWMKRLVAAYLVGRPERYPRGTSPLDRAKRASEPWIAAVPGLTRDTSILDVGCGEGARLEALADLGFSSLHGVDPYLPDSRAGRTASGVVLQQGELGAVTGTFGLVTLHHSLEHCPDPAAMLREAARRLDPGGHLLIRIPLLREWAWEAYGVHWAQLDPPRHFYLFMPDGFVALAQRLGLACRSAGYDGLGWSLAWSEAYMQGIPMHGADGRPNDLPFSAAQLREFEARAVELNRQGQGESGYFVMQRA